MNNRAKSKKNDSGLQRAIKAGDAKNGALNPRGRSILPRLLPLLAGLVLFLGGAPPIHAGEPYESDSLPVLPAVPIDFVLFSSETSYFTLEVIGAPDGTTITEGMYASWCIKYDFPIETNKVYQGTLYYSYAENLPAHLGEFDWVSINYVLNHAASAGPEDVQDAIWYFSGRPTGELLVLSDTAQALVDNALAGGAIYAPGPGDRVAVAIDTGANSGIQWLLIELVLPSAAEIAVTKDCPPGPLMPGETLTFTGTVSNTGDLALIDVFVVDDQPVPNTHVIGPLTLLPGESASFTGSYVVPGLTRLSTNAVSSLATNDSSIIVTNMVTTFTTNTLPVVTTNVLITFTTNLASVFTTNTVTSFTTNTMPLLSTNFLVTLITNSTDVLTTNSIPAYATNSITVYTTNSIPVHTTNSVPVYTTNSVAVYTTNSVPVYTTNSVTIYTTNSVPVYTTNMVAVFSTNTVPVYATNLVTEFLTNIVDVMETNDTTVIITNVTAPFFGTINIATAEAVDRFEVPGGMDGLSYADQDKGYAATQFYSMRKDSSGNFFFDTITAGTATVTDRFDAGQQNFDSIAFAAPDVGYGPVIFYFLSRDTSGVSTFGTIKPGGVVGVVADLFVAGDGFDSITFSATDVGYGANLFYYVRHDALGNSTFGTIDPALPGTMTDRFGVGKDVRALVFTSTDIGYGPNHFYYLRGGEGGVSTFGTIFVSGGNGTVTDRFDAGPNAHELTVTTTDVGFGPNMFYYLRGGVNLLTNTVPVIVTNQVEVITTDTAEVVSTNLVEVITTDMIAVVTTSMVDFVTSETSDVITTGTVEVVTTSTVDVVMTNAVDLVTTNTVDVVTTSTVDVVMPNAVDVVTTNAVDVITTSTIDVVMTNTVDMVTTSNVDVVMTNTVDLVTTNTVSIATTNTVFAVTTNTLSEFTTNTVAVVTTNTVVFITTNVVASLATDTVTATGFDALHSVEVAATSSCSVWIQPSQPVLGGAGVPRLQYSQDAFDMSFLTQVGVYYTVQHTASLSDPDWSDLPFMPVLGTGGVLTITDATVGEPARFYRVMLTP